VDLLRQRLFLGAPDGLLFILRGGKLRRLRYQASHHGKTYDQDGGAHALR
jgi:hypothetical protein